MIDRAYELPIVRQPKTLTIIRGSASYTNLLKH